MLCVGVAEATPSRALSKRGNPRKNVLQFEQWTRARYPSTLARVRVFPFFGAPTDELLYPSIGTRIDRIRPGVVGAHLRFVVH